MKNVKITVAAVWAWALVSGALAGRVATFTGAVSTDLSVGENWDGGTVPGDDAVAVVDFAKLGDATAVTNSADLALAGLVLTNLPPNATLWGTNADGGEDDAHARRVGSAHAPSAGRRLEPYRERASCDRCQPGMVVRR